LQGIKTRYYPSLLPGGYVALSWDKSNNGSLRADANESMRPLVRSSVGVAIGLENLRICVDECWCHE
jgi:hypothetical protein